MSSTKNQCQHVNYAVFKERLILEQINFENNSLNARIVQILEHQATLTLTLTLTLLFQQLTLLDHHHLQVNLLYYRPWLKLIKCMALVQFFRIPRNLFIIPFTLMDQFNQKDVVLISCLAISNVRLKVGLLLLVSLQTILVF